MNGKGPWLTAGIKKSGKTKTKQNKKLRKTITTKPDLFCVPEIRVNLSHSFLNIFWVMTGLLLKNQRGN